MKPITMKFNCFTLSPIHIGTGEDIEPFSYVIQGKTLYCFDFMRFSALLSEHERSELQKQILNPGSVGIIALRRHIKNLFDTNKHKDALLYSYDINNKGVLEYYNKRFDANDKDVINNLAISSIFRTRANNAAIPGSSMKGAIRAAVLKNNRIYENIDIQKDPFAVVSVGDIIREKPVKTDVGFVHLFLKDKLEWGNNLTNLVEYINSDQIFPMEITIDNNLDRSIFNTNVVATIEKDFEDKKSFLKAMNDYYGEKLENDYNMYKNTFGAENPFIKYINKVESSIKIKEARAFINIGKYGGQTMKGRIENIKKYRRHLSYNQLKKDSDIIGKNIMPMGWICIYY